MKNGRTTMEYLILIATVVLIAMVLLGGTLATCSSCGNKQTLDFKNYLNVAYVLGDDGKFEKVKITAWKDWKDSDAVKLVAKDGRVIYTHLRNIKLVKEERD